MNQEAASTDLRGLEVPAQSVAQTPLPQASEQKPPHSNYTKSPVMFKCPKPGFMWNPLREFPVNQPCPCGSGKKFKKCHRNLIADVIPVAEYEREARNNQKVKEEKASE